MTEDAVFPDNFDMFISDEEMEPIAPEGTHDHRAAVNLALDFLDNYQGLTPSQQRELDACMGSQKEEQAYLQNMKAMKAATEDMAYEDELEQNSSAPVVLSAGKGYCATRSPRFI